MVPISNFLCVVGCSCAKCYFLSLSKTQSFANRTGKIESLPVQVVPIILDYEIHGCSRVSPPSTCQVISVLRPHRMWNLDPARDDINFRFKLFFREFSICQFIGYLNTRSGGINLVCAWDYRISFSFSSFVESAAFCHVTSHKKRIRRCQC